MTIIAVASAKGSPGASTFTELLVGLWPAAAHPVLVDCDPAGGEWLLRPGVAAEPGLVTLAMAGRRELASGAALSHVQLVGTTPGLDILVAPAAARQSASALEILGDRLGTHLRSLDDVDVIIDCGRLAQRSPALATVSAADLVVLVSRPTVSEMVHLAPWVEQLVGEGRQVGVVLVGGQWRHSQVIYQPAEVAEALGVPVFGSIDHDPAALGRLWSQPGSLAGLGRSRLVRSAQLTVSAVSAALADHAHPAVEPTVSDTSSEEAVTR